jgi:hypothetical protein
MNLRRLEPAAGVVVKGLAIGAAAGVWGYCWCRGAWLKLRDALT